MANQEYYNAEGIVRDSAYDEELAKGDDAYRPTGTTSGTQRYNLRDSTLDHVGSKDPLSKPDTMDSEFKTDGKDTSKKLAGYVGASHRTDRTTEQKEQSALKASKIHQDITGDPLEINDKGEVVTE